VFYNPTPGRQARRTNSRAAFKIIPAPMHPLRILNIPLIQNPVKKPVLIVKNSMNVGYRNEAIYKLVYAIRVRGTVMRRFNALQVVTEWTMLETVLLLL